MSRRDAAESQDRRFQRNPRDDGHRRADIQDQADIRDPLRALDPRDSRDVEVSRAQDPLPRSSQRQSYPDETTSRHGLEQRTSGPNEYFLPGEDINREVITADICGYLGSDALVRPYLHQDGRPGYLIRAYRALTTPMIASLKDDSRYFEDNNRRREAAGQRRTTYDSRDVTRNRDRYSNDSDATWLGRVDERHRNDSDARRFPNPFFEYDAMDPRDPRSAYDSRDPRYTRDARDVYHERGQRTQPQFARNPGSGYEDTYGRSFAASTYAESISYGSTDSGYGSRTSSQAVGYPQLAQEINQGYQDPRGHPASIYRRHEGTGLPSLEREETNRPLAASGQGGNPDWEGTPNFQNAGRQVTPHFRPSQPGP